MKRKLTAILACRNGGSRLYAKPLQNLDEEKNINIISYLIKKLKKIKAIDEVALAISEKKENLEYINIAKKNSIKYVLGDDRDVLSRLIKCAKKVSTTDVLRITSESPFPFTENLKDIWKEHIKGNYDASFLDNIIDGCGYEIIKTKSLMTSYKLGSKKHRSEFCTLYMRENHKDFNINRIILKKKYFRKDLRLTVDNPEDLILCKSVYNFFKNKEINLKKIISFLDKNPYLKKIISHHCKTGYKTMYNWGKY